MTVNERVAKLEALVVGNGGKGLYEIEDEHYKDFKEFKKRFYDWIDKGREQTCYFLTDKKRKRQSTLLVISAIGVCITGIALIANLIVQLGG